MKTFQAENFKNKSDDHLKTIAAGAVTSLFFGAIGYILMFVFKLIAARYYGPEKFGLFEMANTLLNIGGLISLIGIHSGVSRYIAVYEERKQYDRLKGYLGFIFKLPILISFFVSFFLYIEAVRVSGFFNFDPGFAPIIKVIALAVPFRVVNEIIYQIFFAKRKVLIKNLASNIIERGVLVVGMILASFYQLDIYFIAWLLFLSLFLSSVFSCVYFRFRITFEKSQLKIFHYKDWLYFSIPLFLGSISSFFINWTDNLVIGKFLTSRDLGIYATSFSLASFLLFFQVSFNGIFIPTMSRLYALNKKEEFSESYKKAQKWAFGLSLPFGMLFIFFAKHFMVGLYGDRYVDGSVPLIILSLALLYNVYTGMNEAVIKIAKKTTFLFKTKLFFAIFNVILSILLVMKYGISGVAFSTAISIFGEQTVYFFKSRNIFNISHYALKNLEQVILGVILAFLLLNMFDGYLGYGIFQVFIISGIYIILFFMLTFLFGIYNKNDILLIRQIIKIKYEK